MKQIFHFFRHIIIKFSLKLFFSGTASDSLSYHRGFEFGTFDKDLLKCASEHGGGWWYAPKYGKCVVDSNLNAVYKISWGMLDPANAKGSDPKTTEMKIRPMNFSSNTFTH